MPDPAQMALMIPILALLIPIIAIIATTFTKHKKDMAEIQARMGTLTDQKLTEELTKMRQEMAELRETSTRFDMSFDAAITRLEQRVDRLEDVAPAIPTRRTVTTEQPEDITVQLRR